MRILKDVLAELFGMFVSDWQLTAALLAVVALVAVLLDFAGADPLLGGFVLLAGCLAVLVAAVLSTARGKNQ